MFKELLPTLGIVLTALLGVITYAFQERAKRQTALAERRQALYEKLIRNLVDLLIATSGAERSKLITEIEKGWLFASDQVLRASYEYLKLYDDLCHHDGRKDTSILVGVLAKVRSDERVRQQLGRNLAQIFLAMRQDIRTETVIKADWAKQHFQIYDWGAIAQSDKPVSDTTASGK
jgi:hypothetical protein